MMKCQRPKLAQILDTRCDGQNRRIYSYKNASLYLPAWFVSKQQSFQWLFPTPCFEDEASWYHQSFGRVESLAGAHPWLQRKKGRWGTKGPMSFASRDDSVSETSGRGSKRAMDLRTRPVNENVNLFSHFKWTFKGFQTRAFNVLQKPFKQNSTWLSWTNRSTFESW